MKTYHKILLLFLFACFSTFAFGQNTDAAKALIKEGIELHDAGKYDEAISKYQEALKLDAENMSAMYELSYTMCSSGKSKDAIPYLEKLTTTHKMAPAFDLLGSTYDDDGQFEKAEACYKAGMKAFPDFQRLHFNLAMAYLRQKRYPEAETYAIEAIKMEPKHPGSQRAYAMATYGEEKRGVSLLAWCSFLLLEPQTKRSEEANRYIHDILNYGIKQTGEKSVTINVAPSDIEGPNLMMPISILAATSDKKGLTKADSLSLQLKNLFNISESFTGKKADPFYKSFFSDYFKKLAQTDNMPAFTRLISLTANKDENLQWFKDNNIKLSALEAWVGGQERKF
ncbi:MAG: tetratricopeptide repeat protein [Mucilaginibacter sp.]|uniref:tetratricopeptide repeat protein n=1 Tax=Mucilaginibacter sp. TaxID=1882438 RepID=UPI0031A5F1E3